VVSRGLGPQQLAALELLDNARGGLSIADLSAALDLSPSRTRVMVGSLVDRSRVVTTRENGRLRVWDRKRLEDAEFDEGYRMSMLRVYGPFRCPECGSMVQPSEEDPR
jgi:hypothetical protein